MDGWTGETSVGCARRQCCSIERTNDGARDEAKGGGAQGDESNGGYVLYIYMMMMTTTTTMRMTTTRTMRELRHPAASDGSLDEARMRIDARVKRRRD